jgi:hypothetical protein
VIEYVFGCIQETLCLPPSLPPSLPSSRNPNSSVLPIHPRPSLLLSRGMWPQSRRQISPQMEEKPHCWPVVVGVSRGTCTTWKVQAMHSLDQRCSSICQIFSTIISPPQKVGFLTYEYVQLNISPTELMLVRVSLLLLRV